MKKLIYSQEDINLFLALEQENYNDKNDCLIKEKRELQQRIDEAIEYIERYLRLNLEAFDTKDLLEKILEILNKDGEE